MVGDTRGVDTARTRHGGAEHEYWKHNVKRKLETLGYTVTAEHPVGNGKTVDLRATRGTDVLWVEIETGRSDITANIEKCKQLVGKKVLVFMDEPVCDRYTQDMVGFERLVLTRNLDLLSQTQPIYCRPTGYVRRRLSRRKTFDERVAKPAFQSLLTEARAVHRRDSHVRPARNRSDRSVPTDPQTTKPPDVLRAIHAYLAVSFAKQERPQVNSLATWLHTSRSTLTLVFRRQHGASVGKYLQGQIIHRAKHLLTTTKLTASKIGAALGFTTDRSFHRAFRRATGTTPTA